ncbi:MAG: VOC family protein [Candidatus Rokubacteria bacterium]|nr:VOC family protein [Candidatus Rokubacteria bacterium]
MKKLTGEPWMLADGYGRGLPPFTVNLIVRDVARSLRFYRDVLGATVHYSDPDFAALKVGRAELTLHADHTYDKHPWYSRLTSGEPRGLGAELRLFGVYPDAVEARACEARVVVVQPATRKEGHGWREVTVEDPDGYVWAVGVPVVQ